MHKKIKIVLALIVLVPVIYFILICTNRMTGTVVDAASDKPIEGAVVLVEWTMTKGLPGLTYTTSYEVREKITKKNGEFTVYGVLNSFVDEPNVTVYKQGYVTWSSRWIFPDRQNRTDFRWRKAYVFNLEKFKDTYSYTDHQMFTHSSINSSINLKSKKLFMKTYDAGEREKVIKEQNKRDLDRMRDRRP